ncbi:MMS19 nucleotide excision repair protein homolog (MMS19-like protein) [Durusdinium trenchii]|uniref:MMS19 nucleotide excision repair protein n=1 Tax=Durusdinium trenchii TaxID=1381693 RepID=A0ABP0IT56_9DINO
MAQHMRGLEGLRLESLDQKSGAQAWLDAEQHLPLLGLAIQIQAVAWSAPKSSQSAGWAAAAGWAAETAVHRCQAQKAALEQDRQVEHAGAHAELSPQRATSAQPRHWERHAWQSWEAGRLGAEKVQTPSQTPCPARKKKSWKKSQTATVKMFRSWDEGRDDRSSREEGRGRKPSSLSELNSEVGVAVAGMAMGWAVDKFSADVCEEPDDELLGDRLHQRTVWHLIEKVLLQRPQLEAGKRVTVEIPEWIFDATQNVAYDHSSDPRRSMVNRALRGMSKKLPGCCWTVDMENQDGPLSAQGDPDATTMTTEGDLGPNPTSAACEVVRNHMEFWQLAADLRMWREYAEAAERGAVLFHAGALKSVEPSEAIFEEMQRGRSEWLQHVSMWPNHMAFIANGFARARVGRGAEVPDREVFQRMPLGAWSEEAVGLVEHFEPSSSVGYGEQQLSLLCNAYARLEVLGGRFGLTDRPRRESGRAAVDDYVAADVVTDELREATLQKVLTALNAKEIELLDIVVHLEKVMCDASNPTGRRHAIQFLAFCLRDIVELKLNFKHVEVFAKFFQNKLSDWQCVEGAVAGILVLFQRQAALIRTLKVDTEEGEGEPMALHLARTMLKEVNVPSHTQGVRKSVLDTLLLLSNEWREELTMLGPELGDGISAAIEEERDPRNLLISFTLVKKVLGDFPAACASRETVQSLFETLSSYFPITFQPPKGDKVGITGDDLRQALSQAFCSSQRLAELVIPFLLDASKDIEADVDATVAQAMQTLCFCLQNFGATAAQKHLKHILETCRDQVCRTKTTCGAEFCKAVTESLKVSLQGVPAGLHPHWLAKDVVPQLQEMADDASKGRMSLASEGARQLLLSAAAAHPIVYESVWSAVMKAFLEGKEGEEAFFSIDALEFMVELLQRQQGVFTAKQLQPALKGALETMRTILPQSEEQLHPLVASVELVKRLARLSVASEALQAWQMALLGAAGQAWY